LLTGIYGGDPEKLSAASVLPKLVERERLQGSLTRGLAQEADPAGSVFESMRGGLGQLIAALHPEHLIQGKAESVIQHGQGWQVRVNGNWLQASHVVIACPAHQAALLLAELDSALSKQLGGIPHSSARIVSMGFRNLNIFKGFGLLIPKKERLNLMAATWVNNKFPGRAAPGLFLVRAFFRQPTKEPVRELQHLLGFKNEPEFMRSYEWPESLPQYAVGHAALVLGLESRAAQLPGLHLIGNAYHGVGIPDCVRLAHQVAAQIAAQIGTP
jgi:oxygen-dependent protoporphyrinogen oxidase